MPILIGVLAAIAGDGMLDAMVPAAADATPYTNSLRENFIEITSQPQITQIGPAWLFACAAK